LNLRDQTYNQDAQNIGSSTTLDSGILIVDRLQGMDQDQKIHSIIGDLKKPQRSISSSYLYDDRGCQLFEKITQQPEYYLTRTEVQILKGISTKLTEVMEEADVVELGGGNGSKIAILFDAVSPSMINTLRYIPLDISHQAIVEAAKLMSERFPGLSVHGIVADFSSQLHLIPGQKKRLYCFLGSTIGNFSVDQQRHFMQDMGQMMGPEDLFILGLDMVKSHNLLEAAYNDRQEVTAAFNRNILNNINRIVGTNFEPSMFDHLAFFNQSESRIEMHLKAKKAMMITSSTNDLILQIRKGETIHTENSHKFTISQIEELVQAAGLKVVSNFRDDRQWFSLLLLEKQ